MGPIGYLISIAVILLAGVLCALLANKFKIPNILLLLLIGMIIGNINYKGAPLIEFPFVFLTTIGSIALVMVVFDASSRFKIKEFDHFSFKALKLSFIFLILNLVFLSIFTNLIFKVSSVVVVMIFAAMMSGTDPAPVLSMFNKSKAKPVKMLEIESIINTPIVVLIPFIIIQFAMNVPSPIMDRFIEQITPFLQQIIAGIGSGILIGIIFLKMMRKKYSETLSPIAIITAALLTYALAEILNGNGVVAVTTMGLLFGNIYVKEKAHLHEFSSMFANSFEIIVFVLIGIIISLPLTAGFFIKSVLLFLIYIFIRYAAINMSFGKEYTHKEKMFMGLNAQKGITVAVLVFIFFTMYENPSSILYNLAGVKEILDLSIVFMLYSIILSTATIKFSRYFLGEKNF